MDNLIDDVQSRGVKPKTKDCGDLAWEMFTLTGQLGYYMLHHELSHEE